MNLEKIIAIRNTKTIFKDKNNCIKLFYYGYAKADVLNEALNQSRVEELDINIPKIKSVETIDNKWAIITEFIDGETMSNLLKKSLNKDEYLNRFIDLQLHVQSHECSLLTQLKDKLFKRINNAKIDDTIKKILLKDLEELPNDKALCHGDFYFSNIIVGKNKSEYILDWSHATQGCVLIDIARTYLLIAFCNDLELAEKYLDLLCSKVKYQKNDIKRWIAVTAAAQFVKANQAEREFLYPWILSNLKERGLLND